MNRFFLFSMCCLQSLFSYEIIETAHFSDLLGYSNSDTLIFLDIDDTLLIPKQSLGNDAWFRYRLEKNRHYPDPLDKTLAEWEAIRHLTGVQIVEQGSAEVVQALQKLKTPLMGLTTQGLTLASRTSNQLKELQINFSETSPYKDDLFFNNGRGVLLHQGILFTGGTNKGTAVVQLLHLLKLRPERIVFINDKQSHLLEVASALDKLGIPFIGLRYSYSDERVAAFSPEIAEVQFHHSNFHRILSDEEAHKILHSLNCLQP